MGPVMRRSPSLWRPSHRPFTVDVRGPLGLFCLALGWTVWFGLVPTGCGLVEIEILPVGVECLGIFFLSLLFCFAIFSLVWAVRD